MKNTHKQKSSPVASYERVNYNMLAAKMSIICSIGGFFFFYTLYGKFMWVALFVGSFASVPLFFLGRCAEKYSVFELHGDYMTISKIYSKPMQLAGDDVCDYYPTEHFVMQRILYKDIMNVNMHHSYAEIYVRSIKIVFVVPFSEIASGKREEARRVFNDKMHKLGVLGEEKVRN